MVLGKIYRFFLSEAGSSKAKCNYLRKQGAEIGEGTVINGNLKTFGTEPYLIKCGKNCLFAYGVHLVTHDGGVSVLNKLNKYDGKRADIIAKIEIGDNVYIGTNAMVMPGVRIGSNVVIGASAVVTHDIPDNSVVVGIPARVIKTIDEYYEKHKNRVRFTVGMPLKDKKKYYNNIEWNDLFPADNELDN